MGGSGAFTSKTFTPINPGPGIPTYLVGYRYYYVNNVGRSIAVAGTGTATRLYVTGYAAGYSSSISFGSITQPAVSSSGFLASYDAAGNFQWVTFTGSLGSLITTAQPTTATTQYLYNQAGEGGTGVVALGSGSTGRVYGAGTCLIPSAGATTTGTGTTYVAAFTTTGTKRWGRLTTGHLQDLALAGSSMAPVLVAAGDSSYTSSAGASVRNGLVVAFDTSGTRQATRPATGGVVHGYALATNRQNPYQVLTGGEFTPTLTAGTTTLTTTAGITGWLGALALPPASTAFTLSSISPNPTTVGTTVTLTGTNLNLAAGVSFNGVVVPASSFVSQSATSLVLVVPAGATSGLVTATATTGATASLLFVIAAPAPTLTGLSPTAGPVGTTVTLTGTNLTGTTALTLNGQAVTSYTVNAAGTSLTFTVPASATAGPMSLTTAGGSVMAPGSFCVQYTPTATAGSRCGPGSVTLTAGGSPAAGGTYAWYATATSTTPLSMASTYTTPSLTAGTTFYVAISTGSGSTACEGVRLPVAATIAPLPTVSVAASGPPMLCPGQTVTLTATGASSYLWSTGATTSSITVSQAGSYSVAGTSGSCTVTSAAVVVTPGTTPMASITANGPLALCSGGSVVLTAASAAGSSYLWSTGATTPSISVSQAGPYSVTVNNGSCAATSAATMVSVSPAPPQPTVTQAGSGSGLLASSAATGNQWYLNGVAIAGATGSTCVPTGAGTYTVVVTSAQGCPSPASAGHAVVLATAPAALLAQVQLYPNPTQGRFTLELPTTSHTVRVRILNALGQAVLDQVVLGKRAELNLTGQATGVYAVCVQAGAEQTVKRLVLE